MLNLVKTRESRGVSPAMSNLEKDADKQEPAQNWGQICCSLPRQNKQTGIKFPSLHPLSKTESEWPELWPEICAHVCVLMPDAGEQELTCPAHRQHKCSLEKIFYLRLELLHPWLLPVVYQWPTCPRACVNGLLVTHLNYHMNTSS